MQPRMTMDGNFGFAVFCYSTAP